MINTYFSIGGNGTNGSGASNGENSQRNFTEVNRAIRREVTRLSERWSALISQADRWQAKLDEVLPKIHTFQKSLEAVMQRMVEAERAQTALSNSSMARMNNGGTATESEILLFRNQLKVSNGFFRVWQVIAFTMVKFGKK